MSKELIRLRDLCMAFDDELVLDHINLYINDSEFLTLLGPSGCGKTTTLRIIGGFTTPTSGDVTFDGVRINDVPPHKRQINTVFQKYALFPHLDVFENIAFGLRIAKVPAEEIEERVTEMLGVVSLKGFEHRKITQLSGSTNSLTDALQKAIDKEVQEWIYEYISDTGFIKPKQIAALRNQLNDGPINQIQMLSIFNNCVMAKKVSRSLTFSEKKLTKYFPDDYTAKDMEQVIESLLEKWMQEQSC